MRLVQHIGTQATFSGEATPLPGCPDIVVSHGVYSHYGKGTGVGRVANLLRTRQLRDLGYSAVICTVNAGNSAQLKILRDTGWHETSAFRNRRTGSDIITFMYTL